MTESRRGALDPRLYQILVLGALLVYGWTWLEFDITPARAALLLATVLLAQWTCTRFWGVAAFDPRSALISGLSLCLLFRTSDPWLAIAAGSSRSRASSSVRVGRKHLFNPTNVALVAMLLVSDRVWVSPGQWGSVAFFAFLMACAGSLVVTRAARGDVTLAFLPTWVLLVAAAPGGLATR